MAIIFQIPIHTDRWKFSHNNIIAEFNSNYSEPPLWCDIIITGLSNIRLYPLPNQSFWTNLQEYIASLLNNFEDDIDFDVTPADINTFVKDWSKILFSSEINFTINFEDEVTETALVRPFVLLGAEQLYRFKRGETVATNQNLILSPVKSATNQRYYMRYFDGFPFDIGFTLERGLLTDVLKITNNTNSIESPSIIFGNPVNRLVISNGDTNFTLEDYLPLTDGYNELEFNTATPVYLELIKMTTCAGIYIKWLNQYGGYNYWLFNRFAKIDKSINDIGEISNDFSNLEDTISQFKQLGKNSRDIWQLQTENATDDDMTILEGIYNSPKVYLFTGVKFAQNNFNDFIEVKVLNNTVNLKQPKNDNNTFDVRIELPEDYNISL